MQVLVLLTVYKRNTLEDQLKSIYNQTLQPDYLVVFQNENHINIEPLKQKYKFIHIKNDYNTKFFGRFAHCINYPVDICCVLDDDIIPGNLCIESFVKQCMEKNGIMGGNSRIGLKNNNYKTLSKKIPGDGSNSDLLLVDFVGHLWCFKKEWLYHMFSIPPLTFDTGEDMHLCFSSKIKGNINSYLAKQHNNSRCDISNNQYSGDQNASFRITSRQDRIDVEEYFINKYGLKMISTTNPL